MSTEFPLYPELAEAGKVEAERLIEKFKGMLKKAADEVLGELYIDIPTYIEGDSWTNFRNAMMDGFRNYGNRKIQADYDFKQIREQIFIQFREEIIKDLDQDNLAEIERLRKQVEEWKERYHESLDRRY